MDLPRAAGGVGGRGREDSGRAVGGLDAGEAGGCDGFVPGVAFEPAPEPPGPDGSVGSAVPGGRGGSGGGTVRFIEMIVTS